MIMANAYDAFASAYDALNSDADYTAMADHIDKVFARSNIPRSSLVLDLGCGTGMLTRELDARGYDMTGVDSSEEMLGKAYENSAQSGKILYLCQSEAAPTSPIMPEKKFVIISDVRSADERNAMTGESMTRSTATEHMYFTAPPPFFLSGAAAETIPARRNAHKISLI